MKLDDVEIIEELQRKGYKVVVKDVFGETFTECYDVYQKFGWPSLKRVIIDDNGKELALEG